jgi:hypothetical protein
MYEVVLAYEQIEEVDLSELRFEMCHYFDAAFDFNFPFRPLLSFIADCLREESVNVEVKLPDYLEFEDFVEGRMTVGRGQVAIYFEHSLCYILLASNYHDDLIRLASASQGKKFQHEGYGLNNAKFG